MKINDSVGLEVFRALTGLKNTTSKDPITDLLITAFGTNSKATKTNIDTAKIAKSLKVSRRTVYNWVNGKTKPRQETLKKLQTKARQARTTKRGRQTTAKRAKGIHSQGCIVAIKGLQGPEKGDSYMRRRTSNFTIQPDHMDAMFDAWIQEGEKGILNFLENNSDSTYGMASWHFEEVAEIDFENINFYN